MSKYEAIFEVCRRLGRQQVGQAPSQEGRDCSVLVARNNYDGEKMFSSSGADVYSLWHFSLWVIYSIACKAVIFQFIAFSFSLSNLNSFSSRLQSVSSNHELDGVHHRARSLTQARKPEASAKRIAFPGEVEKPYHVLHQSHHPSCQQQPCNADIVTISIVGGSRRVPGMSFGAREPRSGFCHSHTCYETLGKLINFSEV